MIMINKNIIKNWEFYIMTVEDSYKFRIVISTNLFF